MSERAFEIPLDVQALKEGDLFFLWDNDGVTALRVVAVSYEESGCATISAAMIDSLPPCYNVPECPSQDPEDDCEDCGLLAFTLCDIVYNAEYEDASGHTVGGCYCLTKELDD